MVHASPPWSSGRGRHPFKVEIAGSNPAGGTDSQTLPCLLDGIEIATKVG